MLRNLREVEDWNTNSILRTHRHQNAVLRTQKINFSEIKTQPWETSDTRMHSSIIRNQLSEMTHLIFWTICNENSLVNFGTKSHISPATLGNGKQASLFSSERASGAIVASFSLESIRYLGRSSSYLTDGKQNKIIWQNSKANDGVFDLISKQFRFGCLNVLKMLSCVFLSRSVNM